MFLWGLWLVASARSYQTPVPCFIVRIVDRLFDQVTIMYRGALTLVYALDTRTRLEKITALQGASRCASIADV